MEKKDRFSFWKISAWLITVHVVIIGLALILVFYVKIPNQTRSIYAAFSTRDHPHHRV